MATRMAEAVARAAARRRETVGEAVVYHRGDVPYEVVAVPGRTHWREVEAAGAAVGAHQMDFLLDAADLDIEPVAGDWIEYDGRRWEVQNLGDQGPWRWASPHRVTRRIHTRDTGAV